MNRSIRTGLNHGPDLGDRNGTLIVVKSPQTTSWAYADSTPEVDQDALRCSRERDGETATSANKGKVKLRMTTHAGGGYNHMI